MNEKYLLKLQQDMQLKNFTHSTCEDYYRFVKKFLSFTSKEALSITYADIRKFIFHMKDEAHKKASTINVYTAAIRFFLSTLAHMEPIFPGAIHADIPNIITTPAVTDPVRCARH